MAHRKCITASSAMILQNAFWRTGGAEAECLTQTQNQCFRLLDTESMFFLLSCALRTEGWSWERLTSSKSEKMSPEDWIWWTCWLQAGWPWCRAARASLQWTQWGHVSWIIFCIRFILYYDNLRYQKVKGSRTSILSDSKCVVRLNMFWPRQVQHVSFPLCFKPCPMPAQVQCVTQGRQPIGLETKQCSAQNFEAQHLCQLCGCRETAWICCLGNRYLFQQQFVLVSICLTVLLLLLVSAWLLRFGGWGKYASEGVVAPAKPLWHLRHALSLEKGEWQRVV